jgi:ribosome-associated protein
MLAVTDQIEVPLRELRFTFCRSSGPGGQNVNKVNTKAQLRWPVAKSHALPDNVRDRFLKRYQRRITSEGDVIVTSQRFRDRGRNVADCLSKLREMIREVSESPVARKSTRPTAASKTRRLRHKQRQSQKKQLRRPPRPDD